MPHSPYLKKVHPPIENEHQFDGIGRQLRRHRASWEDGERDKCRDEMLLELGDSLFEHCEFLDTKLDIKKREYGQLVKHKDILKKEIEALKEESQAQKLEIAALKSELEKREGAKGTKEQLGSNGDGTRVEPNSQDPNSEVKEAEKPEESKGSQESAGMASSRKRGPEIDAAVDGKDSKKARTVV